MKESVESRSEWKSPGDRPDCTGRRHLMQDSLNGTNHGAIGGWEDNNKERDNEPRTSTFLLDLTSGVKGTNARCFFVFFLFKFFRTIAELWDVG